MFSRQIKQMVTGALFGFTITTMYVIYLYVSGAPLVINLSSLDYVWDIQYINWYHIPYDQILGLIAGVTFGYMNASQIKIHEVLTKMFWIRK